MARDDRRRSKSKFKARRRPRKKVCIFCADNINEINFKDVKILKRFVSEQGKIIPRRVSGNCAKHQRSLTRAIKKARNIALLPFTSSE